MHGGWGLVVWDLCRGDVQELHYAEAEIVWLYSPIEVRYAIRDA